MSLNVSFFRLVIAEVWKKFYLKTFVSECTQWFSMGDFLILSQTLKPIQEWLGPLRTLRPAPYLYSSVQFSSAQSSLSRVQLFVTPWTAAHQASLSIINSRGLLKLMSIELGFHPTISYSVVSFSSCLQSFPASGPFQMSQFFTSGGQRIGVSASTSVLPMNIQDSFPLGWTGWISLQSKGLSRVFSNTTVQSINSLALSFLYGPTPTSIHDY